jgi:hypothetical protein
MLISTDIIMVCAGRQLAGALACRAGGNGDAMPSKPILRQEVQAGGGRAKYTGP